MLNSERFTYEILKNRQRETRDQFPQSLSLRVHRALSWLHRAEVEIEDHDAKFIIHIYTAMPYN